MCYPGIHLWPRDDDTNRGTTGERAGLRHQLDKKNRGVKRVDKRRMDELRVEVGVTGSFKKKLARSRWKRGGHVDRMGDETLTERAGAYREQVPRESRCL